MVQASLVFYILLSTYYSILACDYSSTHLYAPMTVVNTRNPLVYLPSPAPSRVLPVGCLTLGISSVNLAGRRTEKKNEEKYVTAS